MQNSCSDNEACQKNRLFDVNLYSRLYLCFFIHGKGQEPCMSDSDTAQFSDELLWSFAEFLL